MIKIKPGVSLSGLRPEMIVALLILDPLMMLCGQDPGVTITSATDSKHGPKSRHRVGLAVDLRSRHLIPHEAERCRQNMAAALGPEFTVLLEANHFHVQFDGSPR